MLLQSRCVHTIKFWLSSCWCGRRYAVLHSLIYFINFAYVCRCYLCVYVYMYAYVYAYVYVYVYVYAYVYVYVYVNVYARFSSFILHGTGLTSPAD